MTERLFHQDARLTRFTARVLDCREAAPGAFEVVLDRTAFYATSGGQPHDTGVLGGVPVGEVTDRDGVLVHRTLAPLAGEVVGEIDWTRRFDHMQQHTGQHILSRAFIEAARAETVSFHLGVEKVTIDVSRADLSDAEVADAERRANAVVQADREIKVHWTTREEVGRFPLRKPPQVDGAIRVVEVADYDFSACGGTHVARAGEIGLIKVLRLEKNKGGTRVEFLAGRRALADYGWKHELVRATAERFSVLDRELGAAIGRLEEEAKDLRRRLRSFEEERLDREADALWSAARPAGAYRVVCAVRRGLGPEAIKGLALRLRGYAGAVALLAGVDSGRGHLVFARSDGLDLDMARVLRAVLPAVSGRGGGRPEMAQGSGDPAGLEAALEAARAAIAPPEEE